VEFRQLGPTKSFYIRNPDYATICNPLSYSGKSFSFIFLFHFTRNLLLTLTVVHILPQVVFIYMKIGRTRTATSY